MGTYGDLQSGKGGTYRRANEAESAAARDAKRRVKNTPDQLRALTKGILLSGADEVDARGAQLETMIGNVGKRLKGQEPEYTGRQAYDAVMKAQAEADKAYQNANPIESTVLTAGGSLLMPGGGAIAKGVLGSGKGLLGSTALGARAFRGAMLGGLLGGVEGFAGGEQGKRVEGAKSGVAIGAGLGAALPVAGAAVGQVGKGAKRVANKLAGGTLTNPNVAAGERLAAALKKDGLSPDQIRAAQNEWLKNGVTPQLMNLGGENTRRLLRAAANKGGAANTQAVRNVERTAAALPDAAQARTRALVSDPRSIPDVESDIAQRIASNAQAPNVRMGQAGAAISSRLNRDFDAAQAGVNRAYDAARTAAPEAAYFPRAERPAINAAIREAVRDYDPLTIPAVSRELGRLDNLQTMSARDLFEARQRLGTLRVDGGVESSAAGRAIRAIDEQINAAMQSGSLSGDPEAVRLWQQAIQSRRQMGQDFQGGDLIEDLTRRAPYGGDMRAPVIGQDDASSAILGRGAGLSNRLDLTRDLGRLRSRLGEQGPEWTNLQREAAARVLGPEGGSETFGDAWMRLERDNPELAAMLMSSADRSALDASRQAISGAVSDRTGLRAGQGVLNTSPDRFAADVSGAQRLEMSQLGGARSIEDAIGRPAAGATGTLNRIADSPNVGRNLETLFGQEATGSYQEGIRQLIQQLNDARFVSPNSGSKTAAVLEETGLLDALPPTSKTALVMRALDMLRRGLTLTEQERAALMELGVGTDIERALRALPREASPVSQYGLTPLIAGTPQW